MSDPSGGAPVRAFVMSATEVAPETWDDARGRIAFHTLVSGGATPSDGLVAGLAIVEPGGSLAKHRHEPAEIYHIVEGQGVVTIDGVRHAVSSGATVFIPGNAWHAIENGFQAPLRFFYVFPGDRFEDVEYVFA
jgi:quercetin dioxygenase-like cupin family protein